MARLLTAAMFSLIFKISSQQSIPQCKIFCEGPLLEAVQKANIFPDSKEFVDMPLKHDPDVTLRAFSELKNKSDATEIKAFVREYFNDAGDELEQCNPGDFVLYPESFSKIKDPLYRQWAFLLHSKWRTLCRKVKPHVLEHPTRYSLIPVPHPFVAPGGRFRELYYWDSFWIIKGLLASQMHTTAKNMIRNLAYMVQRFGFVPNGSRIYYLNRSQPPLLPYCVEAYYEATGDLDFVREMLPVLEKEYSFWVKNRTLEFKEFKFYHYNPTVSAPRPESYREDLETANHLKNESEKHQMYSDIAAACESGWDFSSRWFSASGAQKNSLRGIQTSKILPVDLNAFICGYERILAQMYSLTGNYSMAQNHQSEFSFIKHALHKVFWNEEAGSWFDIDLNSGRQKQKFYLSNPTPLFTKCAHDSRDISQTVINYLRQTGASLFPGGLPTSFEHTGQQWDSPNGWAPTNQIVIQGLMNYATTHRAQDAAFELVDKWIQTNYFVFLRSGGKMFEKYNVELELATAGEGGEYEVQEGFGWTNGVILELLLKYGDRLRAPAFHSFHAKARS